MFKSKLQFGTGALKDPIDHRDRIYDGIAFGAAPFDWEKGYNVIDEIKHNIFYKNQDGSESCVGQAWSYYNGILNTVEVDVYDEVSAKSIYSQIALPTGGAYIRSGAKLMVDYGANFEYDVSSYDNEQPPKEAFIKNRTWMTDELTERAKILQAKEYRTIKACDNMDLFAIAIRDNYGVVGGVAGSNNGTWNSDEPKPPQSESDIQWHHALYYGVAGQDDKGRFISTPNSWGTRDRWQKLRKDYFTKLFQFNPWTLTDKPNYMDEEVKNIIDNYEKMIVTEGEGAGRKGIMVAGKLMEIVREQDEPRISAAEGSLYVLTNNGYGITVTTELFNKLPKGNNF